MAGEEGCVVGKTDATRTLRELAVCASDTHLRLHLRVLQGGSPRAAVLTYALPAPLAGRGWVRLAAAFDLPAAPVVYYGCQALVAAEAAEFAGQLIVSSDGPLAVGAVSAPSAGTSDAWPGGLGAVLLLPGALPAAQLCCLLGCGEFLLPGAAELKPVASALGPKQVTFVGSSAQVLEAAVRAVRYGNALAEPVRCAASCRYPPSSRTCRWPWPPPTS